MDLFSGARSMGGGAWTGTTPLSALNVNVTSTSSASMRSAATRIATPAPMLLQGQGVPGHLLPEISSQLDDMQDMDPRFMKEYLAAIMILNATDPQSLDELLKCVKSQMQLAAQARSQPVSQPVSHPSLPTASASAQPAPSASAFSVEVEITTTQFNAWFGSVSTGPVAGQAQGGNAAAADGAAASGQGGRVEVTAASLSQTTIRVRLTVSGGRVQAEPVNANKDPLTLDLNGNGEFDVAGRQGFDVNGDGQVDDTPFVSGGDAFLALDVNGNGLIDSGKELFGDQNGAADGYEELAKYDSNQDGRIDSRDAVYQDLELLGDFNGDGRVEQRRLADEGVTEIALAHTACDRAVTSEVTASQVGTYTRNGQQELAGVLLLKYA